MKFVLRFIFGISAVCFVWGCSGEKGEKWLLACGGDRVLVIDPATSEGEKVNIVWEWQVSDLASQIPDIYLRQLPSVDECKPVEGNRKILITGGAAMVVLDRETKKCLFYAHTPNSHSAELLPNNRIAVALSVAEDGKGNSLQLYDMDKPDRILFRDSLYSGHGAVWIPERERLYALGFDELREYSLKNWETASPALQLERKWRLPEDDGHDLSRVSKDRLLVTAARDVYRFDLVQERFTPFELLQGVPEVKSVNYNETTGQLAYTKAEESWWTHHIYLKQPDRTLTLPDIRLYKVRFME